MKALLTGDSFPGAAVEGKVSLVRPYVDTQTRTVQVEVSVDNGAIGYRLKPGMFARVFLVEKSAENALVVPAEAVLEGKAFIVKDGKAVRVSVQAGLVLPDVVQVTGGLSSGDLVVVAGGSALKDGEAVSADMTEVNP